MEPTDLNSPSAAPDELDRRLQDLASPALPDAGFSQRVLAALPARRLPWGQTWLLPAVGAAVGLALVLGRGASAAPLIPSSDQIGAALADPTVLSAIAIAACAFALLQFLDDGLLE